MRRWDSKSSWHVSAAITHPRKWQNTFNRYAEMGSAHRHLVADCGVAIFLIILIRVRKNFNQREKSARKNVTATRGVTHEGAVVGNGRFGLDANWRRVAIGLRFVI